MFFEGLKEQHASELSDEKQSCHLSLASLVKYLILELRFLVHNSRSHALGVWFFGRSFKHCHFVHQSRKTDLLKGLCYFCQSGVFKSKIWKQVEGWQGR